MTFEFLPCDGCRGLPDTPSDWHARAHGFNALAACCSVCGLCAGGQKACSMDDVDMFAACDDVACKDGAAGHGCKDNMCLESKKSCGPRLSLGPPPNGIVIYSVIIIIL